MYLIQMLVVAVLSVAAVGAEEDATNKPGVTLPQDARVALDGALWLSGRGHYGLTGDNQSAAIRQFHELLDRLAEAAPEDLRPDITRREGETAEHKLIVIAIDRKERPERYDELVQYYMHSVDNPEHIAPASPPIKQEHLNADYRLIWEYILFHPIMTALSERWDERPGQALSTIGNEDSVVSLVHGFRISAGGTLDLVQCY